MNGWLRGFAIVFALVAVGLAASVPFLAEEAPIGHARAVDDEGTLVTADAQPDGGSQPSEAALADAAPTASSDEAASAGADEARIEEGAAGDDPEEPTSVGMARPAFPPSSGTTPTPADRSSLIERQSLKVRTDADFTNKFHDVIPGNGTLADPYIIEGFYVRGDLSLIDTDACTIIRENYIEGQLTLNWNGQCVHVHHNYISDLRVNENIPRDGYATGGLLESNKIQFIGQLRHYDGEFRHNLVGPRTTDLWDEILETVPWGFASDPRVANIDGFNQGLIHHNTFHGSVDLDLHGHHHGTGFFAPMSHYHGDDMQAQAAHPHDHTQRWTSVAFTDNKIIDHEGYGLRYEDRNHAGDDRTAKSEQEDDLEFPHVHYTHVVLDGNVIEGGQLWVDVFNADDRNHLEANPGWLDITNNHVTFHERGGRDLFGMIYFGPGVKHDSGIHVEQIKEVRATITGNTVHIVPLDDQDGYLGVLNPVAPSGPAPMGLFLGDVHDANVTIADNRFSGFHYGLYAEDMTESAHWIVADNRFDSVAQPIWYDRSVANDPEEG